MINKTEQEIMADWKNGSRIPVVSICCVTYNHEKYISETIDGFLMQETDFAFEILIHDDCSEDNTQKIILNYVEKYPNIIRTVFQKENQYSKGIKRVSSFLFQIANGEYYALCEGDDFWTDSRKLQIQLDAMKQYPNIGISFHPAFEFYDDKGRGKILARHFHANKLVTTSKVILGGGIFCPTASLMFKKEALSDLPEWFYKAPVGDYFMQILGSSHGGALYIDRPMSIYRKGHSGSWTNSFFSDSQNFAEQYAAKNQTLKFELIETLKAMNAYYDYKYDDEIQQRISIALASLSLIYFKSGMFEKFKMAIEKSYKTYKKPLSLQHFLYLFKNHPYFLNLLYKYYVLIKKNRHQT